MIFYALTPASLISALAIHLLKSIILKLAPSKISLFYLVSVAEKAGFGNPDDRSCHIDDYLYSCKCGPNPQTWFM